VTGAWPHSQIRPCAPPAKWCADSDLGTAVKKKIPAKSGKGGGGGGWGHGWQHQMESANKNLFYTSRYIWSDWRPYACVLERPLWTLCRCAQ
jgi:hypothetical protein